MGYEMHIRKEIMHEIKVFLSLFYLYDEKNNYRKIKQTFVENVLARNQCVRYDDDNCQLC